MVSVNNNNKHLTYCLTRQIFLSLCCLFRQRKSKKMRLMSLQVDSETKRDNEGYTKRERPSAFDRRTLPIIEMFLWSQLLRRLLVIFILGIQFRSCRILGFSHMWTPKYLTVSFTGMPYIHISSVLKRASHLLRFKFRPEALENDGMFWSTSGIRFLSFKNNVVSSASWEILISLSMMVKPSRFGLLRIWHEFHH